MIHEVVVTTVNEHGAVHIAPMGIWTEDGFTVIAPFKPSQTLTNVELTGVAVVNVTDDVRLFAGCVTGRSDWPVYPATMVNGNVLDASISHNELRVVKKADDELRPRIYMIEVHNAVTRAFRGFNRAQAAIIEASVLVSRLDMLPAEKIDAEMEYLSIAVEKTSGAKEKEAWQWLVEAIENFRQESD
ncbi:MAG: DUF447 family protein [Acidiferrobacterales bacterium]|nr:DUF447 family protein [Acidiferrobacterales bacterium]